MLSNNPDRETVNRHREEALGIRHKANRAVPALGTLAATSAALSVEAFLNNKYSLGVLAAGVAVLLGDRAVRRMDEAFLGINEASRLEGETFEKAMQLEDGLDAIALQEYWDDHPGERDIERIRSLVPQRSVA